MKLLACESIYWSGINSNIKKRKNCPACLEFWQTWSKEQIIHHEIPGKSLEVVGADMFTLHNKNYLCILNYHSTFPVIKKTEDLLADSLILACKIIFSEYGPPRKIMSDAGSTFMSEKFEKFCKKLNIKCAASSSYQDQSNGQVEVCVKVIKQTIKMQ